MNDTAKHHIRQSFIQRRNDAESLAPMKRPVRASAAYAKPSFIYEKRVKNCNKMAFTAKIFLSPLSAEALVKKVYTATRQKVRMMMSQYWQLSGRTKEMVEKNGNDAFYKIRT